MTPVLALITDRTRWGSARGQDWAAALVQQVGEAARAGVSLVQVREPGLESGELVRLVAACVEAVRGSRCRVVVNDRIDVALAAGAHGVHLRGTSVPAYRARHLLPRPLLLGKSVHEIDEVAAADPAQLDYLVFGTVFETPSKPGRPPTGLPALARAVAATRIPVLALGGVTVDRLGAVAATGVAGVAGIGLFAGQSGSRAHAGAQAGASSGLAETVAAARAAFDTHLSRP